MVRALELAQTEQQIQAAAAVVLAAIQAQLAAVAARALLFCAGSLWLQLLPWAQDSQPMPLAQMGRTATKDLRKEAAR